MTHVSRTPGWRAAILEVAARHVQLYDRLDEGRVIFHIVWSAVDRTVTITVGDDRTKTEPVTLADGTVHMLRSPDWTNPETRVLDYKDPLRVIRFIKEEAS